MRSLSFVSSKERCRISGSGRALEDPLPSPFLLATQEGDQVVELSAFVRPTRMVAGRREPLERGALRSLELVAEVVHRNRVDLVRVEGSGERVLRRPLAERDE